MTIPFVRVHGDPFECGRQHGAARGEALRTFLADGLCRLDRLVDAPVSMDSLRPALAAYRAEIAAAAPALAEEIEGLADGAGIDVDQALLLQCRREIMGYQRVPSRGDCTTYARSRPGRPVLAQTVDLNGGLDDQVAVLDVSRAGSPRRSLVLSFAGLLGYLGVNGDGLAVGLNLVLGGEWRPGLPPYLAIRHVLDTASGVEEAVEIVRSLRLASSRSLTLCDASRTCWVEVLGDEVRVRVGPESTHTNHFLHPDLAGRDELNVFAVNFSRQRLDRCRAALAGLAPGAEVDDHFAILAAPPICVAGAGDIRRERTVAAVVVHPDRGELHVRPGDPSRSATESFGLERRSSSRREIRRPGAPDRGSAPRTGASLPVVGERGPQKQGREMGCMGGEDPSDYLTGALGEGTHAGR